MKNNLTKLFIKQCTKSEKLVFLDRSSIRKLQPLIRQMYQVALLKHQRRQKDQLNIQPTTSWKLPCKTKVVLGADDSILAHSIAKSKHSRRKNWKAPEADFITDVISRNHGKYSKKCWYTRWSYTPTLKSYAFVSKWGGKSILYCHYSGNSFINAPRGWYWKIDVNGLCLRSHTSFQDDFHPTSDELKKGTKYLLGQAVKLRNNRNDLQCQQSEWIKQSLMGARGIMVGLQDSIHAGNCNVGSMAFAERYNLDIEGYYTPSKLLKLEPSNQRIKLAILIAYRRHTSLLSKGVKLIYRRKLSTKTGEYIYTLNKQANEANVPTFTTSE